VREVDDAIFTRRYYGHCMRCSFCADACCTHGVDVSVVERDRILARADELEPLARAPRARWFVGAVTEDPDFPGGAATRTTVVDGACVFLGRGRRGCVIHGALLAAGEDYHALKPIVSTLFPVTFGGGVLLCSEELHDGSLVCAGDGPTAYDMARTELAHYFGSELVTELDAHAAEVAAADVR
jgi:hypothetical protein